MHTSIYVFRHSSYMLIRRAVKLKKNPLKVTLQIGRINVQMRSFSTMTINIFWAKSVN